MDLEKGGKWVEFCYSSAFSESSQSMSRKQVDTWVWSWGRIRTEPWGISTCVFWAQEMQQTTRTQRKLLKRTKSEWERSPESRGKWISMRKRWLALSGAPEWPSQVDWKICLPFSDWRGYWGKRNRSSRLLEAEIMWQWFENWIEVVTWGDTECVEWWQNLEDKADPRKLFVGWRNWTHILGEMSH